jgi:hypothetical protein
MGRNRLSIFGLLGKVAGSSLGTGPQESEAVALVAGAADGAMLWPAAPVTRPTAVASNAGTMKGISQVAWTRR